MSHKINMGRYVLERKLGEGAMGAVWLGRNETIDKTYAIKVLKPNLSRDEEYRTRFLREARINAKLEHPNAVQVYDAGEEQGLLFIVMELLDGHAMNVALGGQPLELGRALRLGIQLSRVIAFAHENGLVHRDLKPENVMLTRNSSTGEERAVVVDFGLAFIDRHEDLGRMTAVDERLVSGTPAYLSPEQAEASPHIGPPSDVYSLGCTLYEMLTGQIVFDETSVTRMLTSHMFMPPKPPSSVRGDGVISAPLDQLILSTLEKDPARRPTAGRLAERLAEILDRPENQGRGRDASFQLPRSERAVARDTKRADYDIGLRDTAPGGHDICVGVIGVPLTDELALTLSFIQCEATELDDLADLSGVDILLAHADLGVDELGAAADHVHVVAVASGGVAQLMPLRRAGVRDILSDPIDPDKLMACVQRTRRKLERTRSGDSK